MLVIYFIRLMAGLIRQVEYIPVIHLIMSQPIILFQRPVPVYTITTSIGPNGAMSPTYASQILGGSSLTFYFTPNSGYAAFVSVDGAAPVAVTGNSYVLSNITANHKITASFNPVITASAGTGGSISPSGTVVVKSGANQIFKITAQRGYRIYNVLVDGKVVGLSWDNTYIFYKVTVPHTIKANFIAGR